MKNRAVISSLVIVAAMLCASEGYAKKAKGQVAAKRNRTRCELVRPGPVPDMAGWITGVPLAGDGEIAIQASPSVLVLGQQGNWMTIHADIAFAAVDSGSVVLTVAPGGAEVTPNATFADDRGDLVAKFALEALKKLVDPPSATLTLAGTSDGVPFYGSTTITVRDLPKK